MKIIDFIKEVLNVLEIKTDIKINQSGFFEFYNKGKMILREKDRCSIDEKRVFRARSKNQNKELVKIRGGIELIKILVNE